MMKLYTVGPVEMYDEILEIRGKQLPYFRTEEFSAMMLQADAMLHRIIRAPEGAKTIYLTASGTGAMEATVMNCFDETDKVLIVNGGGFGERFVEICKVHNIAYTEVKVSIEDELSKEKLNEYKGEYTGLLVNVHETSIGKLYPIDVISEFCKENNMYLIVDAISSLFADEYDMEKYGVDATIFSSQKALALAPGMSVVVLSKRIVERKVLSANVKNLYFDFKKYLENFERGQTPFTPAVGIFIEYAKMLEMIELQGIDVKIREVKEKADDFRKLATELGFEVPKYRMSNALTPIFFKRGAKTIYNILKDKKACVVTPSGGKLEDKILRIGHMGNLKKSDGRDLLYAMHEAMKEIEMQGGME